MPGRSKKEVARELRGNPTPAEAFAWELLRDRRFEGLKFRRQYPVPGGVVDFYCAEARLAVELDGGVHGLPEQQERDRLKEQWLADRRVSVVRLPNEQWFDATEDALQSLRDAACESSRRNRS